MAPLLIKVCGMTEAENIRHVEQLGIDMIGFIFYPKSPRCLCRVPGYLPASAKRIGVFVDESEENILSCTARFGLDCIQLHGNESPECCRSLHHAGVRLIKAFSVLQPHDLLATAAYDGLCDYYLFDTKTPQYGGSGNQFDWNLLHSYNGSTPFLLSGGISPCSAPALRDFHHPRLAGIDLNSRFETEPGIKDVERIRQFLKEVRKI